jgi:DNA-binding protein HU-beta
MNKQQMIDALAERTGEPKSVVTRVIEAQAGLVGSALADGEEVTLFGIGKLETVKKAARPGRNPQTGETVTIAARTNVKFKAVKALKDAVN